MAVTAAEAAGADIVVVAVPLHKYRTLNPELLAGKIVIDAMNYWAPVDGEIDDFETDDRTSSEIVQAYLAGSNVVKTLNHIGYHELEDDGQDPAPTAGAPWPWPATNTDAKELVAGFIDRLGYDPVDAGPLAAGAAFQPGTEIFNGRHTARPAALHPGRGCRTCPRLNPAINHPTALHTGEHHGTRRLQLRRHPTQSRREPPAHRRGHPQPLRGDRPCRPGRPGLLRRRRTPHRGHAGLVPGSHDRRRAAATKQIKLGSGASIISTDDPVRVFQQFATADAVSGGGRVEITAGRGSSVETFPLFGYDLRDYDGSTPKSWTC